MKVLKDAILGTLGIAALIAIAYFVGKWAMAADARERAYWAQLNAHVIETWADGKEHPDHKCEYDAAWCNPHYAEFLLKNRGGK